MQQATPGVSLNGQDKDTQHFGNIPFRKYENFDSVGPESKGVFLLKRANQWIEEAKCRPVPKRLFSELWHEGEICMLFAPANVGKSILAVQIADSITTGNAVPGNALEAPKQPVIYFDFELSDKQFEHRYSENYSNHYSFDRNFLRAELNPDELAEESESYEESISASIEKAVEETGAKIIIIDNLTYLRRETEKAKDASPLMKHLKKLKNKHNLSMLILAHCPKRDESKPLGRNDLQGSSIIMNFCDSAFAIGESRKDKSIRYIKQIKQRNTEQVYDADNVQVYQIIKRSNFLEFFYLDTGRERDHLKQRTEEDEAKLIEQVRELHSQGRSLRDIGRELQINHMRVKRIIEKL